MRREKEERINKLRLTDKEFKEFTRLLKKMKDYCLEEEHCIRCPFHEICKSNNLPAVAEIRF